MNGSVGVGIVGLGRVSAAHIRGYAELSDRSTVAALCDVDADVLRRNADALGAPGYCDHRELLADDGVDAVAVLLPHRLHYPVALAALEAGKHVIVEKPMAVSLAECRGLIEAAERSGVVLTVAENSRFVEAYLVAKRLLDEGALGDVRLIRAYVYGSALEEFSNPRERWKTEPDGVGANLDAAPHFFYLLRWFFGEIESLQCVLRFWAREHRLPDTAVEDGAVVTGRLANGPYFSIEISLSVEVPWGERLELYGARGSLIIDQLTDPVAVLYRGPDAEPQPVPGVSHDLARWKEESIERTALDFAASVIDGRPPSVDPADAAYAVAAVEAAYGSSAVDGAPTGIAD